MIGSMIERVLFPIKPSDDCSEAKGENLQLTRGSVATMLLSNPNDNTFEVFTCANIYTIKLRQGLTAPFVQNCPITLFQPFYAKRYAGML